MSTSDTDDMVGKTYGELTVVSLLPIRTKGGDKRYRCRCSCGGWNPAVVRGNLRSGHTSSCGCKKKKGKHHLTDQSGSSHYTRWQSMKQRTTNPNNPQFDDYGGRGIEVCEEWFKDFVEFKRYLDNELGQMPSEDHQLDRIDNDLGYRPGNVKWSTRKENMSNRRKKGSEV